MSKIALGILFLVILTLQPIPTWGQPQQPPKSASIVRNDADVAITIEHRVKSEWVSVKLEAHADAQVSGDRLRVATTRADSALVSVELPIEGGKKYRVFFNAQANIWDLKRSE